MKIDKVLDEKILNCWIQGFEACLKDVKPYIPNAVEKALKRRRDLVISEYKKGVKNESKI